MLNMNVIDVYGFVHTLSYIMNLPFIDQGAHAAFDLIYRLKLKH